MQVINDKIAKIGNSNLCFDEISILSIDDLFSGTWYKDIAFLKHEIIGVFLCPWKSHDGAILLISEGGFKIVSLKSFILIKITYLM